MELSTYSHKTQGWASKWIQVLNIHSKNQWIPNSRWKIPPPPHTYTHTDTQGDDIRFVIYWANFLIPSTELQGWTDKKTQNPRAAWCTPSIRTIWMRGLLSRILTVDTLNECEIVGILTIFIKRKEINSLWHHGYYIHYYAYANTHRHTNSPALGAWGEISIIAEIPGLPECADIFMSQNNHST
jgi:hypothetical protein